MHTDNRPKRWGWIPAFAGMTVGERQKASDATLRRRNISNYKFDNTANFYRDV